jgi:hypothetical protein
MCKTKVKQNHPAHDVLIAAANGEKIQGELTENGVSTWCPILADGALLYISNNPSTHQLRVKPNRGKSKVKQKHPSFDVLIAIANGNKIQALVQDDVTKESKWSAIEPNVAILYIANKWFIHEIRVKPNKKGK